jgi:hypothetical protein
MLVMGLLGLGRRGTNAAMLSRATGGLLWVCALELLAFGLVFGLACFVSRATRDDLLLRWRGKIKPILWVEYEGNDRFTASETGSHDGVVDTIRPRPG